MTSPLTSHNGTQARARTATRGRRIRRVLVVGGAGYVGSVLVRRLLDRGYQVRVFDALMYGEEALADLYGRPGFDVVAGDLRDVEAVVRACRSSDAVVHLGAIVGDPACDLDPELASQVNLEATRTLAAVARGMGIRRFVFSSTCAVYGSSDGLLDEDSALDPVSVYARTKMDSETYLLALNGGRFAPVVLRFGTFYGASPRARFDLVVNLLVAKAVSEREITVMGGTQWRPFIHVVDGTEAIIRCLEAPEAAVRNRVFNVGSDDQNYTLLDVADLIAAHVPDVRVNIEPPAAAEANYRVSFARIRNELGFQTRYTLDHGITELKDFMETGSVADYSDTRYSNIKSLTVGEGMQLLRGEPLPSAAPLAAG